MGFYVGIGELVVCLIGFDLMGGEKGRIYTRIHTRIALEFGIWNWTSGNRLDRKSTHTHIHITYTTTRLDSISNSSAIWLAQARTRARQGTGKGVLSPTFRGF